MFLHHPRDDDDDDTGGDAQSHVDDGDDDDDSVQETLQWGFDINQSLANKKEDKPSLSHYKMTIMTMMKMWQGRVRVDFKFSKGEKWNEKKGFHFPPWLQLEMTQEFFCNKDLKTAIYPWNMIQSAISIVEVIDIFLWGYRQLRWVLHRQKAKTLIHLSCLYSVYFGLI